MLPVPPFGVKYVIVNVTVTEVLATDDGMYRLSCSFTDDPEFRPEIYGNDPSIVTEFGEIERVVDIWESDMVPLFVIFKGTVSV